MSDPTSTSLAVPEADPIATALQRIEGRCLALIAGLPTSLTYLAADLCRDLLVRLRGACEVVVINDLGRGTLDEISAATSPVLLLAEAPDGAVINLVGGASFPLLLIDQRFSQASWDFMTARGLSIQDAVRTMARSHIGLRGLADIPRANLLSSNLDQPASRLVADVASALGDGTPYVEAIAYERDLARSLSQVLQDSSPQLGPMPDDEADSVLRSLEAFYGACSEDMPTLLDVPTAILQEAMPPHLPATNTIDLVGPARCLTFGPYLYLPKGRWKARFTFLSKENRSGNTLGFDVAIDQQIKVDRHFDIKKSGKFAFDCEFDHEDAHSPLEFRTFLRRGSIEGEFLPLSLTLELCDGRLGSSRRQLPPISGIETPQAPQSPSSASRSTP